MKKIFTLASALLITTAMFAADHRPTVTVSTSRKYEIVIDGVGYMNNLGTPINITNLQSGRHNVQVYALNKVLFLKTKKLVSSSAFQVKRQDIMIQVDRMGQLQITQTDNGWGQRDDHSFGKGKKDSHQKDKGRNNHGSRF